MKKILILTTLVCTNLIAQADWVVPCPPKWWHGTQQEWVNKCARDRAADGGPDTVAFATSENSIVVVRPMNTVVPFMCTQTCMPQQPATVVQSAPVGPIYTAAVTLTAQIVQPAQVITTAPTTVTTMPTTVVIPAYVRERHPLVGVNVLGLEVGVGY